MSKNENGLNIHQRMFEVMKDMEGKPIAKDRKTGVPFLTLSHDKVTTALRPLFIKHGIVSYASVSQHGRDGNLTWASVDVSFQNIDKPGLPGRQHHTPVPQHIADIGAGFVMRR